MGGAGGGRNCIPIVEPTIVQDTYFDEIVSVEVIGGIVFFTLAAEKRAWYSDPQPMPERHVVVRLHAPVERVAEMVEQVRAAIGSDLRPISRRLT